MTGETGAKRYLVLGGRIYDHDGDIHQPETADLLIDSGIIERIAPHLEPDGEVEILDASGKLVIPGFVNAHYHSHDVMAKGLFEELPFDIWMMHSNPRSFGRRSHEEVRVRTLIGAAESLRNGITTIQDFLTVEPQEEARLSTPYCRPTRRPASASCSRLPRGIEVRSTSRRSLQRIFRSRS